MRHREWIIYFCFAKEKYVRIIVSENIRDFWNLFDVKVIHNQVFSVSVTEYIQLVKKSTVFFVWYCAKKVHITVAVTTGDRWITRTKGQ